MVQNQARLVIPEYEMGIVKRDWFSNPKMNS
jgi:hypothetical protein